MFKFESRYGIGEVVEFRRIVRQVNGKERPPERHVGRISAIHVSAGLDISYTIEGSYPSPVPDEDVIARYILGPMED